MPVQRKSDEGELVESDGGRLVLRSLAIVISARAQRLCVNAKEHMDLKEVRDNVQILFETDVLVVGGGTAGSVAGIASSRNGADTVVVEQMGFLGGTATGGLVFPMMPNHVGGRPLCAGISLEIQRKLAEMGDGGSDPAGNDGWFNPEALKYVLEELATESGCRLLYHTFASAPILEGNVVKGAVLETKLGRRAILSRVTVDATGDADMAVKAGAPYESGRRKDGLSQPMSLRFTMGNVDIPRLVSFLRKIDPKGEYGLPWLEIWMVPARDSPLEDVFRRAIAARVLDVDDAAYFQAFSVPGRPREVGFNCPRITGSLKGHNPVDLTEAEIQGRSRIARYVEFLREYFDGFEDAYLAQTAVMVGVRESRRIVGEYVLTEEDHRMRRKFEDAVARNRYPIDIHLPSGGTELSEPFGSEEYHEIPYRCLVPKEVDGLLVAGRCLSATFEAQASVRIQPVVRALGEAAGTAAAMCAREGTSPRALDGRRLRDALVRQGANL